MPEVDYVVITTGARHVMAEVACPGTDELLALLKRVRALPGVPADRDLSVLPGPAPAVPWTNEEEPPAVADESRGVRSAPAGLDAVDRVLIGELQDDGRASFRDIGQRLGVSERAVSTRFARLVDEDLVRVIAVGNPHVLGFHALAWVGVSLSEVADLDAVATAFGRIPQVSYLVSVSGRFDLMGELVCRGPGPPAWRR
jgi:Lrp/AsnC family transcriptional regulator for asnA, asnC and gidA